MTFECSGQPVLQVCVPALASWVAVGKTLNLSQLQFPWRQSLLAAQGIKYVSIHAPGTQFTLNMY